MFPFDPDYVDYTKCIPNRQFEIDSLYQEQPLECPSINEYLACKTVTNYILKME